VFALPSCTDLFDPRRNTARVLDLFADTPRSLAVSPAGDTV
jgi:hypothetical protein